MAHVDLLRRIFNESTEVTKLLEHFVDFAQLSYGDALPKRDVALVRLAIAKNVPAWNVSIALVLIDLVDGLAQRVVELMAPEEADFARLYLRFLDARCFELRMSSYSETTMHGIFLRFACDTAHAYTMRDVALIDYVVKEASGPNAPSVTGVFPVITTDTLVAARRAAADAEAESTLEPDDIDADTMQ